MAFADINGNQILKQRLAKLISSGNIPQCNIFEGPIEVASEFAESFAKAVLCTDRKDDDSCGACISCRKIESENSEEVKYFGTIDADKPVKIDIIREMRDTALSKSYTGRPTFLIVRNTARMQEGAQNAMLKLLEEPPKDVFILLVTENADSLLETIRSRCQIFRVLKDGFQENFEQASDESRLRTKSLLQKIVEGSPFFEMQDDINYFSKDRGRLRDFTNEAELFFRNMMVSNYDVQGVLRADFAGKEIEIRSSAARNVEFLMSGISSIEQARRDLAGNVSAGHTLKYMIFDIQSKIPLRGKNI